MKLKNEFKKMFGLGEFSKEKIEEKIEERRRKEIKIMLKAKDDTQLLAMKNEKDSIFIDIYNKIINGEFIIKNTINNGVYKSQKRFEILSNNDTITIGSDISLGPDMEGFETNSGYYINFYYMLVNGKKIGSNGYITYDSYCMITNKFNNF